VRPTNSWRALNSWFLVEPDVRGDLRQPSARRVLAEDAELEEQAGAGYAIDGIAQQRLPLHEVESLRHPLFDVSGRLGLGFTLQKRGGMQLPEVELAQYSTGKAVGEALGHGIDDPAEHAPQDTPPFPGRDGMMSQARAG
jgi:hypothetical protein